jgi:beta-N-acetylhexosaminidase
VRLIAVALTLGIAAVAAAPEVASVGSPSVADDAAPAQLRTRPADLKPDIVWAPIPYGAKRRAQMAAYSERHYGERTWALTDPKVIVEHYTDGTTWQGAWGTFASNARHNGEKPGTCAHFLIDTDGTIRQLAGLGVRCRHVVGINYTSIGIEHVGTNSAMVLGNRRQMRASLALTVWLMARFHVNVGNVIGHGEALQSPYHHELYPDWRCLVHADFRRPAMRTYRTRLKSALHDADVPLGEGPAWEPSGCR